MFKILTIGVLIYVLYTMVFKKNLIPGATEDKKLNNNQQDNDEGEYVDYEEVD